MVLWPRNDKWHWKVYSSINFQISALLLYIWCKASRLCQFKRPFFCCCNLSLHRWNSPGHDVLPICCRSINFFITCNSIWWLFPWKSPKMPLYLSNEKQQKLYMGPKSRTHSHKWQWCTFLVITEDSCKSSTELQNLARSSCATFTGNVGITGEHSIWQAFINNF